MTDKTLVPDPAAPKPGSQDAPVPAQPVGASAPTTSATSAPAAPAVGTTASAPTSSSSEPSVKPDTVAASPTPGASRMASSSIPPAPPVPPVRDKAGPSSDAPSGRSRGGNFGWLVIALVVLCVAMGAALWFQRQEFVSSGMTVASRIDALSSELTNAKRDMREALSLAQSQTTKITALESAVRENQAEYSTLEQAWQDFNDTTNDGVLANDVERLLTIASQQLRLGGSVSNAIVALETAQSRLARADRPRFANLQQAVNGDLDRLRAVPVVDVAAQSSRIERLSGLVSRAPLLVPDAVSMQSGNAVTGQPEPRAAAVEPTRVPVEPDAPWWQRWRGEIASWPSRAGSTLAHEMGDLIKIQRVDQPESLLMSASQSEQLRATLRQRLQTIQLALLMRQASVWKGELATIVVTLNNYYEPRSADTQAALRLAESLADTPVAVALPEINDSLNAMAAARAEASPETERN